MLKIMPYNYNTLCDVYPCPNRAMVSIGKPGEPHGTYFNICNECLEDIVNELPLETILKRKDVQYEIKKFAGGEDEITLTYAELLAIAKIRKIPGYTKMNKKELLDAVRDD